VRCGALRRHRVAWRLAASERSGRPDRARPTRPEFVTPIDFSIRIPIDHQKIKVYSPASVSRTENNYAYGIHARICVIISFSVSAGVICLTCEAVMILSKMSPRFFLPALIFEKKIKVGKNLSLVSSEATIGRQTLRES